MNMLAEFEWRGWKIWGKRVISWPGNAILYSDGSRGELMDRRRLFFKGDAAIQEYHVINGSGSVPCENFSEIKGSNWSVTVKEDRSLVVSVVGVLNIEIKNNQGYVKCGLFEFSSGFDGEIRCELIDESFKDLVKVVIFFQIFNLWENAGSVGFS